MKNATKAVATVRVVMEAEVARQIRQHGRSSMKSEVCGVLIGREEGRTTLVDACIAGVNAAQGGAHVTFTQDTWEHIYQVKDKKYPDARIVGWYHSHPGFGVFLSDHDLFIHQNFFSSPQQIAWVYDPHNDEEGCFGWLADKVERIDDVSLRYGQPCGERLVAEDPDEEQEIKIAHRAGKQTEIDDGRSDETGPAAAGIAATPWR
jgi:proteasome lid subunit RPN8/RPN11